MGLFDLFSKVPGWVKNYPDEDDKEVFKSLIKNGANLDEPRELIFCIYASRENADKIIKVAKQAGWQCDVDQSADPTPEPGEEYFVEVKKDGYVITPDAFTEDKEKMEVLARKYDAAYDGWYASV
jgi:thermostable 8-oxoguanine DNA glycosylase